MAQRQRGTRGPPYESAQSLYVSAGPGGAAILLQLLGQGIGNYIVPPFGGGSRPSH